MDVGQAGIPAKLRCLLAPRGHRASFATAAAACGSNIDVIVCWRGAGIDTEKNVPSLDSTGIPG
jgi:hypothetical protein